jgi:urease accessory protein
MPSTDLLLMLLADARLPTAGHTQSAGLEPAVLDGIGANEVPDYMALRLQTVTRVEAATAVVALHHLRQGYRIEDVEVCWAARTPSPAMRATSYAMGRGLLRMVRRLWSEHPSVVGLPDRSPRAVVLAAAADASGLNPLALARLIGYDDAQTVASAALKLLPLDPAEVASWVLDAFPTIDAMAAEVVPLLDPMSIPASGAPQIEVWAEAHAVAQRRLFNA